MSKINQNSPNVNESNYLKKVGIDSINSQHSDKENQDNKNLISKCLYFNSLSRIEPFKLEG
jgi:hypothetical protein